MKLGMALAMVTEWAMGCSKEAGSDRPTLGKERADCRLDKTCDPGLMCLSNLCVRPPPADCTAVGEGLASHDLGNYAEPEDRAPVVDKYKRACHKAMVSKEQGECIAATTEKFAAIQ